MRYDFRLILGGLALIALIGGLLFWYVSQTPRSVEPLLPPGDETGETVGTLEESSDFYEIEAAYPLSTPLRTTIGAAADAEAVAVLKGFMQNQIASFKERGAFDMLSEEDKEMMGYDDGRKQKLVITYDTYQGSGVLSYVITLYEDTFGAHGNTYFRTFAFDTKTGEGLHLDDLFIPGANHLALLSQLSREKLAKSLGDSADTDYIESGTLPEEESFQSWYLEGEALILLFPPYQVGPYALGSQEVRIPLPELGTAIAPEYR